MEFAWIVQKVTFNYTVYVPCASLEYFPDVFSNPGLHLSDLWSCGAIQIQEIRCKL